MNLIKILLDISYCDALSKIFNFPFQIVGFDIIYCARANSGQTMGSRGEEYTCHGWSTFFVTSWSIISFQNK